ncbi:MAG: response regulator, partial [Candidatus Sericytochromatia bacterium]
NIKKVFESFTQSEESITRKYGGTGLGLTISKELLKLMGSDLKIKSQVDIGSDFFFFIKFKFIDSNNTGDLILNSNYLNKKLSILIVEDNKINSMVLSKIIKKWDMFFDVADTGKLAIEKIQQQQYDIILMDLHLPDMTGYDIIKFMKEKNYKIPTIALTASALVEEREKCFSEGFQDYFTKPFNSELLKNRILELVI